MKVARRRKVITEILKTGGAILNLMLFEMFDFDCRINRSRLTTALNNSEAFFEKNNGSYGRGRIKCYICAILIEYI